MDTGFSLLNNAYKIQKLTVACVIPYYNGSKYIERALKSIEIQTVPPEEIIIVNDGSTPNESEFLNTLKKKYSFTIIEQKNGGQGSARNTGVNSSKSNFICFLDQDDFYLPNHIEELKNAIPVNDRLFGYVYSNVCDADEYGNVHNLTRLRPATQDPKSNLVNLLRHDLYVLPSATIISKKAFLSIGGFDPQFRGYEDDDLFLRLFRAGYSNYFLNKPLSVWCMNFNSTSYSMTFLRSQFNYFKKLIDLYPDNVERGEYYLRDCLVPRFECIFVRNIILARNKKSKQDLNELLDYYRQYVILLCKSGISNKYRLKGKLYYAIFKNMIKSII